ncbi:MAG: hypothetical protein VX938_06040 [Myxococcota bacterium]|nr:hypothetical protein [Myxococcota bacterium]
MMTLLRFSLVLSLVLSSAVALAADSETICGNGADEDGDGLADCADSDCSKDPACAPDGGSENTNARCSDWVDNDDNGAVDCDDVACQGSDIPACQGSWDLGTAGASASADLPGSGEGIELESLIGTGGDNDGERSDLACSDGIDNDDDGRVDCEDAGCRFSPDVLICRGSPNMRFSIVGALTQSYDLEAKEHDTRFTKLQLRSFGPIPLIQDSFYLVSMRGEKTPRLTFAMFQIPLGNGHTLNLNSGGGGLTDMVVMSSAKQLLLDPAYYLVNAFQGGNGAAAEVAGPVPGLGPRLTYRVYAAGGAGRSNGNIGGRFFTYSNERYTWSAGGQLNYNLIGHLGRWDSPFLLVPTPTAVAIRVGAKYDQRAQERFPALNARVVAKHSRLIFMGETYLKWEQEFGSTQTAYNVTLGALLIKKKLMLAMDFGQFMATEYENPPLTEETDLRKIRDERQLRVALHYYFWSNIGLASLLYTDRLLEGEGVGEPDEVERSVKLVGQYRF